MLSFQVPLRAFLGNTQRLRLELQTPPVAHTPRSALVLKAGRLCFSDGKLPGINRSSLVGIGRGWERVEKRSVVCQAELKDVLLGLGIFFTPSVLFVMYAFVIGKGDYAQGLSVALTQISRGYFQPNLGGEKVPVCDGELKDLLNDDKPLFMFLYTWFIKLGGVWKLEFGPKAFLVVSDPVVVRHLLKPPALVLGTKRIFLAIAVQSLTFVVVKENYENYDKGVLAEILEPIMGKGLIPADIETWKPRRRAIAPAFHKAYLEAMVQMFGRCTQQMLNKYDGLLQENESFGLDMESEFLSLGLDIIGLGVFNYDFNCLTEESPVIKAVYGVLKEAEHRSTFYFPYWDIPGASVVVPRQRAFNADLAVINDCLDDLISQAEATKQDQDLESLQNRDYSKVSDPSLLRFLVDLRGENATSKQLRDDLMTMLIAGHETTAAVLTWCLFLMVQNEPWMEEVLSEIDEKMGDSVPDINIIKELEKLRLSLIEALRLYPQPPILIRRAREKDVLPGGLGGPEEGYPVGPGADIFISTWNLHRSPHLWENPDEFNPERFLKPFSNEDFKGSWAGLRPGRDGGPLYPNENTTDFAFVPFGGGARKCVGDQFALMEATVAMAMLLRNFRFSLQHPAEDMELATGATIHTANGLMMRIEKRKAPTKQEEEPQAVEV